MLGLSVILHSSFMSQKFQKYLNNWNEVEENLDKITAQYLLKADGLDG